MTEEPVKQVALVAGRIRSELLRAAGALAVLVLVVLGMSGFFRGKIRPGSGGAEGPIAPAGAESVTVVETTVPVIEEAAGSVQAERKTMVSSRILAVIQRVEVSAGDTVAAGDLLIVLDDRELSNRAEEAVRAMDGAAAARDKAASDRERALRLRTQGVISESEFEQLESAFRIAEAELERARQAAAAEQVALSYARITAPVGGRVIDRLADPGDTAVPGRPLLAIYDPSALRIEVPVRESLARRLRVGDSLGVRVGEESEVIDGRVDEMVPQAEMGSRTFLVKVGLPKRPGLYTGMFGRVLIPAGERRRLLAPPEAIEEIGQLDFAYVLDDERRIGRRLVTLGPRTADGRIEVLSGLRAGETVLLRPASVRPEFTRGAER